jgi:hypothetical protein
MDTEEFENAFKEAMRRNREIYEHEIINPYTHLQSREVEIYADGVSFVATRYRIIQPTDQTKSLLVMLYYGDHYIGGIDLVKINEVK